MLKASKHEWLTAPTTAMRIRAAYLCSTQLQHYPQETPARY